MEVKATEKYIRTSPRKLRLMADLVRGKKVDQALIILKFLPTPSAKDLAKAIQSAAANAENNFEMTPSDLKIAKIFIDGGRTIRKTFQPYNCDSQRGGMIGPEGSSNRF